MVSKVAVVIPSFNHANYILAALDSVLNQTLPPDFLVVVDDGSSDSSPALLRDYAAANAHRKTCIRLIFQPNAGAHNALNRGIQAVPEADYIAILNSDDLFEPARLEKCVAFLEANVGVELICTGLKLIDSSGVLLVEDHPKVRRLRAVWANPEQNPAEWLGLSNFTKTTSNFVIRADYARRNPMRDYRYVHDYFFALLAAVEGKLAVIPEPLLRYRTHETNTIKKDGTASVTKEVVRMNLEALQALQPILSTSSSARASYTAYIRVVMGNHTDFRAEVFLALLAGITAKTEKTQISELLAQTNSTQFPELAAPSNKESFSGSGNGASTKKVSGQGGSKSSPWVWLGQRLGIVKSFL